MKHLRDFRAVDSEPSPGSWPQPEMIDRRR